MKTWRTGRDLTQGEAAKLLEMSQAGYSKLEAGQVDTSLSTVAKAAEVTGLSPAALLGSQAVMPLPDMVMAVLKAGYRVEAARPGPAEPPGEAEPSP